MSEAINFPHLGIYLDHVGKSFSVFGSEIAYYGVTIAVAMGEGDGSCTCWGCDLTYEYVKINGDYRT